MTACLARFTQTRGVRKYDADELDFMDFLTSISTGAFRTADSSSRPTQAYLPQPQGTCGSETHYTQHLNEPTSSSENAIVADNGLPYIVTCGLLQPVDFVELLKL